MNRQHISKKFTGNRILIFSALAFLLLTMISCEKEKLIIGTWQRELFGEGALYIERYKFSDDDGEKTMEFSVIPTESHYMGYFVKGEWDILLDYSIKFYYDTGTLKILHPGMGSSLEELANLAQYKARVLSALISRNNENTGVGIKLVFDGDDIMTLRFKNGELSYHRVGRKHKDNIEDYEEDGEEDYEDDGEDDSDERYDYEASSSYKQYDATDEVSYALTGKINGKYPVEVELTAIGEEIQWARYRYTKTGSGDWIYLEISKDNLGRAVMYENINGKTYGCISARLSIDGNTATLRGWHENFERNTEMIFFAEGYRN